MHVVKAPGASVVVGQVTADAGPAGAACVSLTAIPVIVTFPVLVTAKEYVIRSPTRLTAVGEAVLSTWSPGAGAVVGVEVLEGAEVTGVVPPGGVPLAVAMLTTAPAVTSAAVIV